MVREEGPRVEYLSCNAGLPYTPGNGPGSDAPLASIAWSSRPSRSRRPRASWSASGRTRRGLSQLALSLDANVSTKHLSFVETGRSGPGRQLLVHLAQHLDLPITERNRLLLAGGFAPPYLELPYDGDVMQPLGSRSSGCSRPTSRT